MLRKIFWRIYDGNFPFRCALILVQNPLLKHVQPLYFGFMVGLFIRKGLIFPQNPFHKTHKDLSPGHCHRREITLPGEKEQENILFRFVNFGKFSHFCAPHIPWHSVPILFKSMRVWVFRNLVLHGESDFSREIGLFHTCREFREIFKAFYEAFMDLQNLHFCYREILRRMIR